MSAGAHPNGELRRALKTAEAQLRRGERLTDAELEALRSLAADAGSLPATLSRRMAHVTATHALRERRAPGAVLDGLFDDVRSATLDERFGRARVSNAYLDAPRSLVVWRRTAVAACVLAAVSAGWALTADPTPASTRPASQVERFELLDGVLDRYDAGARAPAVPGAPLDVYEVGAPDGRDAAAMPEDRGRGRSLIQIFRSSPRSNRVKVQFRMFGRGPVLGPRPVEVEKN